MTSKTKRFQCVKEKDLVRWQFGPIMFLRDTNRLAQPEPPFLRISFLMSHFKQANAALLIA